VENVVILKNKKLRPAFVTFIEPLKCWVTDSTFFSRVFYLCRWSQL